MAGIELQKTIVQLLRGKSSLTVLSRDDDFYKKVISLINYDDLVMMGCIQFINRGAIRGSLDDTDYNKFIGGLVYNQYIKDVQIWNNYIVELLHYITNNNVMLTDVGDEVCRFIKGYLESMFNVIHNKFLRYKSNLDTFVGIAKRPYFPLSTCLKVLEVARVYSNRFEGDDLETYNYYRSEIEGILTLISVQAKDLILRYHDTYSYDIMEELLRYREETANKDKIRISQNKLAIVDEHITKYKGES